MTAPAMGYVESITREEIGGWACDEAAPDDRLTVELLVDGWPVASAPAALARADLAALGRGRADFAFSIPVPPAISVDMERVAVRVAGTPTLLPVAADAPAFEGFVEMVAPTQLGGWAWHVGYWHERLTLAVELDGVLLTRCTADAFRPDLRDARVGDGCYGFFVDLPRFLRPEELDPTRLQVMFEGTGQQLIDLRAPHIALQRQAKAPAAAPAPTVAPAAPPPEPAAASAPAPAIPPSPESYFVLESPKPRLTREAVEALRGALNLGEDGDLF